MKDGFSKSIDTLAGFFGKKEPAKRSGKTASKARAKKAKKPPSPAAGAVSIVPEIERALGKLDDGKQGFVAETAIAMGVRYIFGNPGASEADMATSIF